MEDFPLIYGEVLREELDAGPLEEVSDSDSEPTNEHENVRRSGRVTRPIERYGDVRNTDEEVYNRL